MNDGVYVGGRYALYVGLVLVLARAQATDFYVSTQGSDSNPGTAAQPFQTITYAYTHAAPGVTIYVMPGVYYDYTSGWGIHLGASGSAASPIVLQSQVRGGAVIDGQNASDRNVGFYIDGSYNVVDGFEIRNSPNGGITIWADGNRIVNNEIHHNGNPASSSTNGRDGVYSNEGTSGNFYGANSIHDNGRSGSNLDHGLYLCGQNETAINNLLYRNAASGLQVAGYTTVSNMKVYNNVIAWNGTSGIILWMTLSGVDIKNNIIYQNGHAGIGCYAATGSGVVADHNLVYGNGNGSYDWTGGGSIVGYTLGTTVSADPAFANDSSSSFDAHLSSGSPAIQAGLNLSLLFNTDIAGAGRPASGAWDLGASIASMLPTLDIKAAGRPMKLTLSATGQPGQGYNVQSSPDGRTWSVIGTMTLDATGWCQFTNASGINGIGFYRLQGR
ncbi:MAG TPA: right-handed parallel beta-helix repeat-containing protein [Candidatus Binatia bacterium]|nr:right-handed parallel beta-helix repeat-containing protein [Candidatus Binatia bacterium]